MQALGDRIHGTLTSLHSAHLSIRVHFQSSTLTATGDEQVANRHVTAMALTETIPAFGTIRLVQVGEKTYVQLPKSRRTSSKPWVLVRPGSSNPVVRALAQTLQSSGQLTQLDAAGIFVTAAKNLHFAGIDTIDGVTAGHYTLTIDVNRLPDSFPQKQTLQGVGLSSLPLDLWVDSDGHTRKVTENLKFAGQTISVAVELNNFNKPVHITAPPASQVDTS